jgi:hypothetical protein
VTVCRRDGNRGGWAVVVMLTKSLELFPACAEAESLSGGMAAAVEGWVKPKTVYRGSRGNATAGFRGTDNDAADKLLNCALWPNSHIRWQKFPSSCTLLKIGPL